jgi:hypothetical protein
MKLINLIKRTPPALALILLAPVLGELVSAHQTPWEFINPVNFLVLSLPYGFGAVLCREFIVRRKKGLVALLLLGVAYGIYEEGIVVHSFFNPAWDELGALARYGYHGGVNWTWSELMVHFHLFISIGASIMLAEVIYTDQRGKSWLDTKALIICAVGLAAWVPLGFFMTDYFPPAGWYAASWAVFLLLLAAAWFLPVLPPSSLTKKPPHPLFFFLLGMLNMTVYFVAVYLTADAGAPPWPATVILLPMFDIVALWLVYCWSGRGYIWNDRHRLALVAGLLAFFIYFCFDKDVERFSGLSIIGTASIAVLWMLWRIVKRRSTRLA